ncbi:MAG: hypothetical protein ACRD3S_20910 [Terracidiphilus sp.]
MPFINGRYYVNPVMGEALEAAREAEAALAALENHAQQGSDAADGQPGGEFDGASGAHAASNAGPIHRVEIESAEMVPANSGRAARCYVARVHRQSAHGSANGAAHVPGAGAARSNNFPGGKDFGGAETHVFADHRDLLTFLRDELAHDAHSHGSKR